MIKLLQTDWICVLICSSEVLYTCTYVLVVNLFLTFNSFSGWIPFVHKRVLINIHRIILSSGRQQVGLLKKKMIIHDIVVEHTRFNILQLLQNKKKISEVYLLFYCVIKCNATRDKINFLMHAEEHYSQKIVIHLSDGYR